MVLAWAQVLLLPLDVSNSRGQGGGIDMKTFWFIVYMLSAIWLFIIIPFMKNYLEADEDWGCVIKNLILVGKIQIFFLLLFRIFDCLVFNFDCFIRFYWNGKFKIFN